MHDSKLIAVLLAATLAGCGDDSTGTTGGAGGTGGGGGDATTATSSCYANCDGQDGVTGCEPFVTNAECKQLCDAVVAGAKAECLGKMSAYYDCTVADGFVCNASFVSPKTDQCKDEEDALDECES